MPPRRTRWVEATLGRRIAVQAVGGILATSLLLGMLAFAGNAWLLDHQQEKDARQHVQQVADRLTNRIGLFIRSTADLAANPVMTTALLDSRERDVYLRPFLANYRLPMTETHGITLCDFEGTPLAARKESPANCFRKTPELDAFLRAGTTRVEIIAVGGAFKMLVLQPVLFPGTGHAEGFVAATLDLDSALDGATLGRGAGRFRLVSQSAGLDIADGPTPAGTLAVQQVPIAFPGVGDLRLWLEEPRTLPDGLGQVAAAYGGGVLAAVLLSLWVARRMAVRLAAPLVGLTATAERIAREGPAAAPAPVDGSDEVARLAAAFNAMLASLRDAQEDLENQVADRTEALRLALGEVGESERRYRALFSGSKAAMLLVDPADGRIIDANQAAARYYGYDVTRMKTMRIGEINTLSGPALATELRRADADQSLPFAFHHRLANGEIRDVEVHSGPIELSGRHLLYSIVHDVTERRRLEEERRLAEEAMRVLSGRLRAVLDAASEIAIIATDLDGVIRIFNTGAQRMLGYEESEVVGLLTPLLFHVEEEVVARAVELGHAGGRPDRPLRAFVDVAERQGWERREWTYVRKDGGCLTVSLTVTTMRSGDGAITGYLGVAQDVTERRQAETALKESEERFRSLIEATTDWVWETDWEHRFTWFSPSFESVLGSPAASVLGKRREDLVADNHEINSNAWRKHFEDVAAHRPFRDFRYWLRTTGVPAKWISISGSPRFDAGGRFLGYRGSGSDVTERAAASMRLRMLAQVVEQSPVSVVITDAGGTIEYVNRHVTQASGWSQEELLGQPCRIFASGETPAETYRELWGTITSGRSWMGELKNRRKDGTFHWESVAISPVVGDDGDIVRYAGIKEDVTFRKEAEARIAEASHLLEQQAEQLRRSNRELEQFAYVASHDLRQPLRAVTSYLTLIERSLGPDLDEELKEFLGFAVGGARRMDALIVDLLEYSRIGRKERPFEAVPLANAVADARADLDVAIREAGAELRVADGLPTVQGDAIELARLFQNLIGNAVKYQAPGRPPVVEVGWRDDGAEWVAWVRDNGIGIEPKDFERVFGVFQRLVTREQYEGTGIGLAVCRKIAEHHGGRIWIESTPGEGSTFLVALPKTVTRRPS